MNFSEYATNWSNTEVLQGKIMIGVGVLVLVAFVSILRSENEFFRGALIPLGLLLAVLIGYGGYILYSRPAHVKESIALYEKSPAEALVKETEKHINDNKAGKTLLRYVYPAIMLIGALGLLFLSSLYFKGMSVGFVLLAVCAYIIDTGFVTRSDAFIEFIETII